MGTYIMDILLCTLWAFSFVVMIFAARGYMPIQMASDSLKSALRAKTIGAFACGFLTCLELAWIFG